MNAEADGTALVTGASSGIGAAFARAIAARNGNLVLVARCRSRLAQLAGELKRCFGVAAEIVVADLATRHGVNEVLQRLEGHPPLDWLVNNAGFAVPGRFAELPPERTLPMIELHVLAAARLSRAALPRMIARGGGRIINVASIGAFLPRPGDAAYCATKAPRAMWMSADAVVKVSLEAIDRRRVVCVPGIHNRVLVALAKAGLGGVLSSTLDRRLPRLP